ncbi:MAG: hypothetical protein EXX96DRAFT_56923 [Benjaminiella poitrasii]|nr:MAG: hypothetical protein EXX96DRAFT_56923 [Benjaminiella poitrasii]
MLNPFANDFTPVSSIQPSKQQSNKRNKDPPTTKNRKDQHTKKKQSTSNKANDTTLDNPPQQKKNKDSQANQSKKKPAKKSAHVNNSNNNRRRSSTKPPPAATSAEDPFEQECKFITIEAAIDPIRRIEPTHNASTSSISVKRHLLEHGYERYIRWIDKSLKAFDTITLVGMDNAVVDVISLINILQDRKIGAHDDIETFSMNTENNKITACIQVKLHSYY